MENTNYKNENENNSGKTLLARLILLQSKNCYANLERYGNNPRNCLSCYSRSYWTNYPFTPVWWEFLGIL